MTERSASSITTIPRASTWGYFSTTVNVLWDLAPHDLSIMDYLIKGDPEAIVATGQGHLNGHEDVAFMTLYFPDKVIAHINVNWLSPVKVRTTLIGGEKRMLVWNDLEADEKVKVYDKGVKISSRKVSTNCWSAIARATCGLRSSNRSRRFARNSATSSTASRPDRSRSTTAAPGCG